MKIEELKNRVLKLARTDTGYLKIFLVIFVVGYIFFFNSNKLFHGSSTVVTPTALDEDIAWEERVLQLVRWEYDQSRQLMEIELNIEENTALDGIYHYKYTSKEYDAGDMIVEAVAETEDMLVIQIKEIPKHFTILSLHINVPYGDPEKDLILYANNKSVKKTEIDERTVTQYAIAKTERKIAKLELEMATSESKIKNEEETIENGKERLQILEDKLAFQIGETRAETESQIEAIESILESCEKNIDQEKENIRSYELEIESLMVLKKRYQEGEDNG